MSKGNLFLGYARGAVGDIVLSRVNGEQVTRARNRHPKNPRSNAQLAQRAVMATIMKAYSAGAEIFDHSFEGLKVGTENQSKFISENVHLFRNILVDELNDPPVHYNGLSLVRPSSVYPVPGPYIVSRGKLEQNYFQFVYQSSSGSTNQILQLGWPQTKVTGEVYETGDAYYSRTGLVAGDLYTFVFFAFDESSDEVEPATVFGFVRLRVKPVPSGSDPAAWLLSDVFDYVASQGVAAPPALLSQSFDEDPSGGVFYSSLRQMLFLDDSDFAITSVACIRSHELTGARSNAQMMWATSENHPRLSSREYVEAWQQMTESVTDPQLLLEGANPNAGVAV